MFKISEKEILDAYKKTGFVHVCGQYCRRGEGKPRACGIVTLYAANHPKRLKQYREFKLSDSKLQELSIRWAQHKYGETYIENFIDGFDDTTNSVNVINRDKNCISGLIDGIRSRKALTW